MANFEAFRWNFSSITNSEIGRSDRLYSKLVFYNAQSFYLGLSGYQGAPDAFIRCDRSKNYYFKYFSLCYAYLGPDHGQVNYS